MQAVRLVNTKNLSHQDWLEYRRNGIGGSDVAAICNMSRYRSKMHVYLDKIGELPPLEDNPKMAAGRKLELLIADWFAEDTGYKVWRQNAIFSHPEYPYMLANIDRWLPGQNAGLECKNTGEFNRDEWANEQVPTEYILQCNHYMAVTGADRWFVAVLIGGWDFQWRVIERDDELIRNLIAVESDFWNHHVLAQIEPEWSHQDTDLIKQRYSGSDPEKWIELPGDAYDIIQSFRKSRASREAAERSEEAAKNQLKGIMQDAEKAYWQGDLAFTWKANKKGVRSFKAVGGDE